MLNWIQIIRKKLMPMPVGLLWMGVAFAAVVTAAQVADAIRNGSMPFCVELDNLKDTDAPIHQPAAMLVAAD